MRALLLVPVLLLAVPSAALQDAPREDPPLFSFAWISDMHLDAGREEAVASALGRADELKPDFVLITGDNNALPAPEDPARPEPVSLRRQRFLKDFLDRNLKAPRVMIPGDNWAEDFEKVFGPTQYGFDGGGVRFLLLSPDRACRARHAEGLSVLDPPTWDWLRKDLEESREKPVLLVIHEPIYPPTFLDAPPLRALLRKYPNVIAVLQGHLHADAEWAADGRKYLVCPSLGAAAAPRFKLLQAYADRIVLRTLARAGREGRFERTDREQRIDLPPALRGNLKKTGGRFAMENASSVPAHPLANDPALAERRGELMEILKAFLSGAATRDKPEPERGKP